MIRRLQLSLILLCFGLLSFSQDKPYKPSLDQERLDRIEFSNGDSAQGVELYNSSLDEDYSSYISPDGRTVVKKSTSKVFIKFKDGVDISDEISSLASSDLLSIGEKGKLSDPHGFGMIELNDVSTGRQVDAVISSIQDNPAIEYVNPFFELNGYEMGLTNTIIVGLDNPNQLTAMSNLVEDLGGQVSKRSEVNNLRYIISLPNNLDKDAMEIAEEIHTSGLVKYAEPDFFQINITHNTNDPLVGDQWSLDNTGANAGSPAVAGVDMCIFDAWNTSTGNPAIAVAVIDEGVELSHPEFAGKLLQGFDPAGGVTGANAGNANAFDSHGTNCAGIIAAQGDNNLGIAGVAYDVSIIPIRGLIGGGGTFADLTDAIDWAWQNGADAMSNSWGGGGSSFAMETVIDDAVTMGRGGLGTIVLASSGNSEAGTVGFPARYEPVVAVGAIGPCGFRVDPIGGLSCASWNGFQGSSFVGPGPDVVAPGVNIFATTNGGGFNPSFGGTSAACPNAAGVAALILSVNPSLDENGVREALETTATKLPDYTFSPSQPNQPHGTWNQEVGYGLVNACDALQAASGAPLIVFFPDAVPTIEGDMLDVDIECEGYKDISIELKLLGDVTVPGTPSGEIVLDASSTATEGEDFDFLDPAQMMFSFAGGLVGSHVVDIRVYNDYDEEADETIVLDVVNFDNGGSDAAVDPTGVPGVITITNDDFAPTAANIPTVLVDEGWQSGSLGAWTLNQLGGGNEFVVGDQASEFGEFSAYVSENPATTMDFSYNGTNTSRSILTTPLLDMGSVAGETISYQWYGDGEALSFFGLLFHFDYGRVGFIDPGFTTITFASPELNGQDVDVQTVTQAAVPAGNQSGSWFFAVDWQNDGSVTGANSFAIDNIFVADGAPLKFETSVTGANSAWVDLGPNSTAHFVSKPAEGSEIIASITNNSTHDYGCTLVEVDRSGAGATPFWSFGCNEDDMVDKTILVTPEFENSGSESFDISLYYTESEIAGWEATSGGARSSLLLLKSADPIPSTTASFDADFQTPGTTVFNIYGTAYHGSYTGNLGGGYGLVPEPPYSVYNFIAVQNKEQVDVSWELAFDDSDVQWYIVEESEDGTNWRELKTLPATGASSYTVTDYYPEDGGNFYRIRAVTTSCGIVTSENAYVNYFTTGQIKAYPNPAVNDVTLLLSVDDLNNLVSVDLYNELGEVVQSQDLDSRTGVVRWTFDVSGLAPGQYYFQVENMDQTKNRAVAFVKVGR